MPEERRVSPALIIIPAVLGLAAIGVMAMAAQAKKGIANLYGTVGKRTEDGGFEGLPNVQVILDDQETTTDQYGNYYFYELQPGAYSMLFSLEGYQDHAKTVTLTEGQNRLDVLLVPVGENPPPPTPHTLTVEIDPVDAGWVTIEPDKPFYEWGEYVLLTAFSNEEYVFDYWEFLPESFFGELIYTREVWVPMVVDYDPTAIAHFIKVGATPMLGNLRLWSASSPTPARQITIPLGEDFHVGGISPGTGTITLPEISADHPLSLSFLFRALGNERTRVPFSGGMEWEGPQAATVTQLDIIIKVTKKAGRLYPTYIAQPGTYPIYSSCSLGPNIEGEPYFTFWEEQKTLNLVVTITE